MSHPIDLSRLTPEQADGLACALCGLDYLAVNMPHRPVGYSETGSQIFVCSPACLGGAE